MPGNNKKYNCVGNLAWDRRGASAVVFAGTLLAVMGFVGLATEGSSWYLGRRAIQIAADAAANAGALAAIYGGNPTAAANSVAARNGFASGSGVTIGVNITPGTGTSGSQVQVSIQKTLSPLVANLFGVSAPKIGAVASAQVKSIGTACVLSLNGTLSVTGGSTTTSCALASNSSGSTAINVNSGASLIASSATVTTVGGCCGAGSVSSMRRPASPYHPPTLNPFSTVGSDLPTSLTCNPGGIPAPTFVSGGTINGVTVPSGNMIVLSPYSASPYAYCSDLVATPSTPVLLPAGTYFFKDASFVNNGGIISCQTTCNGGGSSGVTLVFSGSPSGASGCVGPICLNSGTTVINPRKVNPDFSSLSGVLFYGSGLGTAYINASNTVGRNIGGGIYFPNATVMLTGNNRSASVTSPCLAVVAASVNLFSNLTLNSGSCGTYGTTLATIQAARFVQ